MSPPANDGAGEPLLRAHMPELDTLRGIAVLGVLFYHGLNFMFRDARVSTIPRILIHMTEPGWMGVNLFFVLSGFLITGILLDSKGRSDYFSRFYRRRALRILPAYYALLILLAVLSGVHIVAKHIPWPFLFISAIYLSNFADLFGVAVHYGVLWTLAIEEQFYLFWPAVVRLFSRRALGGAAIFICVLCPALRYGYVLVGGDGNAGYTWLCADGLAIGALVAVIARTAWAVRARMVKLTGIFFGMSLILVAAGWHAGIATAKTTTGTVFRPVAMNCFFAGVLLLTLLAGTSQWKALVNRPVLQWFGAISYGLYLIHMMAFDVTDYGLNRLFPFAPYSDRDTSFIALRFAMGAGLAIAVSYLSRWYFEEPFLRLKSRWES